MCPSRVLVWVSRCSLESGSVRTPSRIVVALSLCASLIPASAFAVGTADRESYLSTYAALGLRTPEKVGSIEWGDVDIAVFEFNRAGPAAPWALLTHGLFDNCGYMAALINHLESRGYNVLCYDLPGHGLSSHEVSDIGEFENYSRLLDTVRQKRPYDWRLFAAHSTGSVSVYYPLSDLPFHQVLLFAPLVLTQSSPAVDMLARSTPEILDTLPRIFLDNTSSDSFNEFHRNDPYQPREVDLDWVRAWARWQKQFRRLPVLNASPEVVVFQGDQDRVVEWVENLPLLTRRFGAQLSIRMVPGASHGLLNEADPYRALLLKHIDAAIPGD